MGHKGSASTHIAASPEKVYALISDVTRMGDWSPETVKCEWVDGATGPAAGARFKGTNKLGIMRWSTKPTVEVAEPGKEFTFATGNPQKPATRWSYTLTPSGDGTKLVWILHRIDVNSKIFTRKQAEDPRGLFDFLPAN